MATIPSDAYPLTWPAHVMRTPPAERKRAKFGKREPGTNWSSLRQVTISNATARLMAEISAFTRAGKPWRIDPKLVVISSDMQLRRDGLPYSGRGLPTDPGVAVYFELDGVPHCMPCDRWDRMPDNLAAIAAHIGALRAIERWGVGDIRQAFAGFVALPAPSAHATAHWTDVLGVPADADLATIQDAHRRLRSTFHPDRLTGDAERFHQVNQAFEQARAGFR
ncbi:J domain-containing protein [Pseudoxanthomonas sp. SE1]|uniref:J domain-containing protein n=1 Tax=Pseudoxanthomonas sp. SE1 TaxID=1664560 RepID=UPI00240D0F86|nr:J domain-containing protein [Pseudoxanthomonas sp. SE1]WFC43202.1 J domain-containing protein [Pseudoxanthomonas sp. SE1]